MCVVVVSDKAGVLLACCPTSPSAIDCLKIASRPSKCLADLKTSSVELYWTSLRQNINRCTHEESRKT
jgi:hypothetical protein